MRAYASSLAVALFVPWRAGRRVERLRTRWLTAYATFHLLLASALCVVLSSWAYLAGKGAILGLREMDMGVDDLPPDTPGQVALGLSVSLLIWAALLGLLLGVCLAVARRLNGPDQDGYGSARKCLCLATPWLVVWAGSILFANAALEGELRHPAAAVRAYAQLKERGYRGSSAVDPGQPVRSSFTVRSRLLWVTAGFPIVWAVGLRPRNGWRGGAGATRIVAVGGCWLVAWVVSRVLPWIAIGAYAG